MPMASTFLHVDVIAALGPHYAVPFPSLSTEHVALGPVRVRRIELGMQRRMFDFLLRISHRIFVDNLARFVTSVYALGGAFVVLVGRVVRLGWHKELCRMHAVLLGGCYQTTQRLNSWFGGWNVESL